MKFRPRARAGKYDWLIVCGIAALLLVAVFFLRNYPNRIMAGIIVVAFFAVFLYYYYLVMGVRRMIYTVQNNGIRIKYGFMNLLLPYEEIEKVEIVRRSNWRRLFGVAWRDYFAGCFTENKFGIVQIYATTNLNMIYIKTKKARYAISPANNQLFLEEVNMRWEKPEISQKDALYLERGKKIRLWKDPISALVTVIGILLIIGQLILAIYVWTTGYRISLLDYNMSGDVMVRRIYFELIAFPLATLFFVFRTVWSSTILLHNGVKNKRNSQIFTLLIALAISAVMLCIIFMG